MKKLNNKGFTLIELLAVIVILAIIMVVTIPNILTNIDTNKKKMFNTSADTVAKWVEDQYGLYQLGDEGLSNNFKTIIDGSTSKCSNTCTLDTAALNAAGVKGSNYTSASFTINNSGRACVTLVANNGQGDFKGVGTTPATSSGCTSTS